MGARELSAIKPQLDANNVRLVGVGVEELGVEEFVQGKFWSGELYIDEKKQSYEALGFKRLGYLATAGVMFSKALRAGFKKASDQGIKGNFKGDGFQNGGTIVVAKDGKVLFEFKQIEPTDHVDPNEILSALGIKSESNDDASAKKEESPKKEECSEDVCTRS